jgi:ribosomal protein L37AE/L43A
MLQDVRCPECGSKHWAMHRGSSTTARCDDCLNTFRLLAASPTDVFGVPFQFRGLMMSEAEKRLDDVHEFLACHQWHYGYGSPRNFSVEQALEVIEDYWDLLEPDRYREKSPDSKSTVDRQQVNS